MENNMQYWRSELEMAKCPCVEQILDKELSAWLFEPGPDHLQLLQWGLVQLDPRLKDYFLKVHSSKVEQEVVKLVKAVGLCKQTEDDVILGRADRSKQAKMWGLLFKMLRRSKKSSGDFRTLTNASCKVYGPIKTKQFWNVLATDPRLLPIEWHLAAIKESTHQLQKQLDDATHELNQLEEFKSESMDASLELDSFQGMPSVEERTIKFKKLMSEIKDSYHTLAEKVLPHLRTHPQMTEDAKVFGICVKALIGKLTPVVKHLSGVEETKKLVDLFGSKQRSTPPEFYHLHDYISKSCSMLSELIVMMNGLHSKSVDNVNFI